LIQSQYSTASHIRSPGQTLGNARRVTTDRLSLLREEKGGGSRSVVEVKVPSHHFYRSQSHEPAQKIPCPLLLVKSLSAVTTEDLRRLSRRLVPGRAGFELRHRRAALLPHRSSVRLRPDAALPLPAQ